MIGRRSCLRAACAAFVGVLPARLFANAKVPRTIEVTIASSHTTSLPWVGVMHTLVVPESNRRLAAMDSPYRIHWTEAYGGSLYKYQNTLEAVQIGLTDLGWVGTLWELSKMPLQNVTYYAPFVTDDFRMLSQIMNQLHRTMPVLKTAWSDQNQRFLGASVVDTYHLMTTYPVRRIEDLRGHKILAPGPSAAWLEGTGAVPVDGGLTTYYTQIQTGVADGVLTILSGAAPYRIHEVAPYVTLVGVGAQMTGGLSINLDTWRRLPPGVARVLTDLGHEYSEAEADALGQRYRRALATMRADGAKIAPLPQAEKRKWLTAMPDIAGRWVRATERRGYPAGAVLHAYMNAVRERGGHPLRNWDRPAKPGA